MSKIETHAGDFLPGIGRYTGKYLLLHTKKHRFMGEKIHKNQLVSVEIATEENVKKLGGTLGWGGVGGVLLGPVGLLAGLMLGGKKKKITFAALFSDGRKLLATTDSKTFTQLQAAAFSNQ